MRKARLTRQERIIEDGLVKGEYRDVYNFEFSKIAESVAARRKNAVLHIRINSEDLYNIKNKAHKLGVKYQTFVSEVLHRLAKA